jgi:hypothetical protein
MMFPVPVKYPWVARCSEMNKTGPRAREARKIHESSLEVLTDMDLSVRLSRLIRTWLEEAREKGMLKESLDFKDIANFILISLNGAAALYMASRDGLVLEQTIAQLQFYLHQLRK